MEETTSLALGVLSVAVLVAISGCFVAAELALARSDVSRLKNRDSRRRWGTDVAVRLLEEIDLSLSATQFGIGLASLVLGWWGERAFASYFFRLFEWFGAEVSSVVIHAGATAMALGLVAVVYVTLGEIVAKGIAVRSPEMTLRILGPGILAFAQLCRPMVFVLNHTAGFVLRLFGIQGPMRLERVHSSADLTMLLSQSSECGAIDKEEERMARAVFGLSNTVAREIMTPRTDMAVIPFEASFDEVIELIVKSGFSRFPVTGENVDDVQGILLTKDLLPFVPRFLSEKGERFEVRRFMREPFFIPGTKSISDLLNEFKRRTVHFAIVLDEHGGVDGVVTLEDLIEEIVGDIFDESDVPEKSIIVEESGEAVVDGGVLVCEVNERFLLDIPEGDYDTIGGFVFSVLGRIPREGDEIAIESGGRVWANGEIVAHIGEDGRRQENQGGGPGERREVENFESLREVLRVERVDSNRVEQVRLINLPRSSESESPGEESSS